MAKVSSLAQAAKKIRQKKAQGKTLCGRGFHKWVTDTGKPFDVKLGKLVTTVRCERCGKRLTHAR